VIYEPGDTVRDVFLVRQGHVLLWHATEDVVRPRTVALAGPGEMFGLESVFGGPGVRRRYGARAGEGTTLTVLSGSGVARAFRTGERTFAHAFRSVFDDLALARRFGTGRGAPTTCQRIADVLLDLGQRFGIEEGTGFRIELRVTHQVLADLAGAHRSTVTTLLNDWMYRRIVKDTGSGLLVRPRQLARLSSGHGRTADPGAPPRPGSGTGS
jgi:CRP-like cAMP-binding protein